KVHSPLFAMSHAGTAAAQPAVATAATTTQATPAAAVTTPAAQGKALASPAVRRLARALSIDLSKVPGSGDKGRVYKEDVRAVAEGKTAVVAPVVTPAAQQRKAPSAAVTSGASRVEPIKGIKAAMARQMVEPVSTIPHFTYCDEIDLTEMT